MKIESLAAQVPTVETIRSSEARSMQQLKDLEEAGRRMGHEKSRDAGGHREEDENKVAPEEILDRIEEISEEGTYSVRFEKNEDLNRLVVKLVDRQTDEVVRQIPPEEILGVKAYLREYTGNIVNSAY